MMRHPMNARDLVMGHFAGGGDAAPEMPPPEAPAEAGDPVRDAMQDFMEAVKSGDPQAMADAFRMAFKAVEMEPHMEAGEEMPEAEAGEQG